MEGHRLSSSNVPRDDEESASFFHRAPLSAGSSPSPLLYWKATRRPTTRRHVVIRLICSHFAAAFRMASSCARANSTSDDRPSSNVVDKAAAERGEARRPSLEELIRMEATSSTSRSEETKSQEAGTGTYEEVSCCWKEMATSTVVFSFTDTAHRVSCTAAEEEEQEKPLSASKNHGLFSDDEQRQTAIVPVHLDDDAGRRAVVPGGSAMLRLSPAVVVLASLRAFSRVPRIDMGPSKGPYWKLAGSRAAGNKAELFYHRPIPMGRRCRVQHLEESPYM